MERTTHPYLDIKFCLLVLSVNVTHHCFHYKEKLCNTDSDIHSIFRCRILAEGDKGTILSFLCGQCKPTDLSNVIILFTGGWASVLQ